MLAREIAVEFPTVTLDTGALEAARLMADQRLPGLVVVDDDGQPYSVLPGSQVLNFAIPAYVQEDPSLARVYGEAAADRLGARLDAHTVRELMPEKPHELPVVQPDDTVMEIAAIMAGMHTPLVAVVEDGEILGVVTLTTLLARVLPPA